MISQDTVQKLTAQFQTNELNIIREYFQHLFLSQLYKLENAGNLLFKGGTALRIIYGSPRFSEDLDFSIFHVEKYLQKKFEEDLFDTILAEIERSGIKVNLGPKLGSTAEGYYGDATFEISGYQPVSVSINISSRNGRKINGEIDTVANDFVPAYTVVHLPQEELVNEKIFSALKERKKPRDFYDLYFIMRKGILTVEQKRKLAQIKNEIIAEAGDIDFRAELGAFLPADQQNIIKDFPQIIKSEINRQIA